MQKIMELKVISNLPISCEEINKHILLAEQKLNADERLRFHINEPPNPWIKVEDQKPPINIEVDGYNKEWIHPDFNPEGVNICFLTEEDEWAVSIWDNDMDSWDTLYTDQLRYGEKVFSPTHWKFRPTAPKK